MSSSSFFFWWEGSGEGRPSESRTAGSPWPSAWLGRKGRQATKGTSRTAWSASICSCSYKDPSFC